MWLFELKPLFTVNQLERLSNISDNAGQVVLAVVVLTPMISGIEKVNVFVILSGVVVTIFCWLLSVWFAGKGELK